MEHISFAIISHPPSRMPDSLGNPGGMDENINLPEMVCNVLDGVVNRRPVAHVGLIEADVYAGLSRELPGSLVAKIALDIENGDSGDTGFGERLGHVVAQTTSTAGKRIS